MKGLINKLRRKKSSSDNTIQHASTSSSTVSPVISSPDTASTAHSASITNTQTEPKPFGLFRVDNPVDPEKDDQYPVDIIAVHGLNGHAYRTWTHQNGTFWIKHILPSYIPGCRVFTYGYPSKVSFSPSFATVEDFARGLLGHLRDIHEEAEERRSIILVCHSLGGIVCKQALVFGHQDDRKYGSLLRSIVGITFLATPHRGSNTAEWGKTMGAIVNIVSQTISVGLRSEIVRVNLLQDLEYDSQWLLELELSVRNRFENMLIISFYETEPTPPLSVNVVNKASAILGIADEDVLPLFENHRDICRFPGKTQSCIDVCRAVRRIFDHWQRQQEKHSETNRELSEEEKKCLRHFNKSALDDYQMSLPELIHGTCQWIWTDPQFISWLGESKNVRLWLTGCPGSGKTMISISMAKQLEQESSSVLIYFCDDKYSEQKDAKAVLIGLIAQLAHQHRSMVRHIKRVFDVQGESMIESFSALWNIFENITNDLKSNTIYVIIDALDECEAKSRDNLIFQIDKMMDASNAKSGGGKHIKFLLTSRPTVGQAHETNQPQRYHIVIDDNQSGREGDLRLFIKQKVEEIVSKRGCEEETKDFLLHTLSSRADQTFLWIKMVLSSLERSPVASIEDFRGIIAKLPPDLEEMYLDFLSAVPKDNRGLAWQLLSLLFASSRPLLLSEINIAFSIKPRHESSKILLEACQPPLTMPHTILSVLGPLVRVTGSGSESKVSLVHQTVKDFLLVDDSNNRVDHIRNARSVIDAITVEKSAECMASACIRYLLLTEFSRDLYFKHDSPTSSRLSSIVSSSSSSSAVSMGDIWNEDGLGLVTNMLFSEPWALDPETSEKVASKYDFYRYAALHWAGHFARCEASAPKELVSVARQLLDVNKAIARNWLNFYRAEATNAPDDTHGGFSPLALAAHFNHSETLTHFLATRNPTQLDKNQALFWAADAGHSRIIVKLLGAGADPNYHAVDAQTALTIVAAHGRLDCLIELLANGQCDINTNGRKGRTALSFAAGNGHQDIVKHLLSIGDCNANEGDNGGVTPLMWATVGGHVAIVSMLAKHRSVDVRKKDRAGRTAVSWAAGDGVEATLECLLKLKHSRGRHGTETDLADLEDNEGRTPLSWAAGNGHANVVETLILLERKKRPEKDPERRVDTEREDKKGRNAIHYACMHGHEAALRMLLKHGCKGFDKDDKDGWAPLAWAVHRDSPGIVEALIARGVTDFEKGSARRSILSWAVEFGHLSVVQVLLKGGANPETAVNRIPLARELGRQDLVDELQKYLDKKQLEKKLDIEG